MEYKLNKIDVELRQRVKDTTKSGVVHRKDKIKINQDKNKDSSSNRSFEDNLKKAKKDKKNKEKFEVEAYKAENIDVKGFKEEIECDCNVRSRGTFLDVKK
ncbi:hypothetical protein ACFIJ5_11750 [Haloimpatiens sp. FM7330]|uniref:hypothetical protein n=1 Tax=Haloimpatiens sp. FM7330 TaxID=3298610 RepID=UPI00362F9077